MLLPGGGVSFLKKLQRVLFREEEGGPVCGHTVVCSVWSEACAGIQGLFSQRRPGWSPRGGGPASLSLSPFTCGCKHPRKDGNNCLGHPAAALGELWGEQVSGKSAGSLALATALLSWSWGQGHRLNAAARHRGPAQLLPSCSPLLHRGGTGVIVQKHLVRFATTSHPSWPLASGLLNSGGPCRAEKQGQLAGPGGGLSQY